MAVAMDGWGKCWREGDDLSTDKVVLRPWSGAYNDRHGQLPIHEQVKVGVPETLWHPRDPGPLLQRHRARSSPWEDATVSQR